MRIFIGWDTRETEAFEVARRTAERFGHEVTPLFEERLRAAGMLTRPTDRRAQIFDLNSNAPQSTEFAITRFFVPLLAHSGWAMFVDCDVVFLEDPECLASFADPRRAVCVVKFPPLAVGGTKMDGQVQQPYPRKLWSSIVLWNCDHPGNRRLNLTSLNQLPGRDLHAFCWLADDEIGDLPPEANWLVGMQPKPERPLIAHYTLGTPNMPGRESTEHAQLWWAAKAA